MPSDFLSIDPRRLELLARQGAAAKVEQATLRTAAIARTLVPGSMKNAIRPIYRGTKANPLGIVMVDHPAASFVLHGTRGPYDIYPKRAKALRFVIGGRVVYSRHVVHPGIKANNFLEKALLAAREL